MQINLKKLFLNEGASESFNYSFSMENVEVDGVKPFISPVLAKGQFRNYAGSVELEAQLEYDFSMPCHRCMEETLTHFDQSLKHALVRQLSEDDNDSYIQVEEVLDLDELFYADILLELPVKYICKEDCRGICPTCGINLNLNSCNCSKSHTDPRLDALKALLEQ